MILIAYFLLLVTTKGYSSPFLVLIANYFYTLADSVIIKNTDR